MVCSCSLSILSPSSSFSSSSRSFFYSPPSSSRFIWNHPVRRIRASSKPTVEDGSGPEMFSQDNTIADFMRFNTDQASASQLQTAVVSYRKKFPWSLLSPFLRVDLVSTIHIADKEYFATLQKELEPYDCVLYEMVASRESLESRRNTTPPKLQSSSRPQGFNILGCVQRQMANVLALYFQLDCLDYQGDNWYHADLDYETFKLLQLEKGENLFTFARDMTLRSTKALVQPFLVPKEPNNPWSSKLLWASRTLPMPLLGLIIIGSVCADTESTVSKFPELEALSRLDFGAAMKVFLARRLATEFKLVTADIEEKSVIIGERNKAATEALRRAINYGHRRIAILYGGGHMPDLGRRLKEEFELVPAEVQWITAWTIENQNLTSSSLPFLRKIAEISGWPLNRYQTLALFLFSSILALDLLFWELFLDTTVNWISHVAFDVSQYLDTAKVI